MTFQGPEKVFLSNPHNPFHRFIQGIKGTINEKWKGLKKPENIRHWTIHIWYLSDFPVSRNWYKTVSNLYENSFICNLNKSCSIKEIVFNKYEPIWKRRYLTGAWESQVGSYNNFFYFAFCIFNRYNW